MTDSEFTFIYFLGVFYSFFISYHSVSNTFKAEYNDFRLSGNLKGLIIFLSFFSWCGVLTCYMVNIINMVEKKMR